MTRRVSPDSSYPGPHRPRALKSYFALVVDAIVSSTILSVLNFRKKRGLASGRVSLSSRLLDLAQSRLSVLLSLGIGAVLFHLSLYSLATPTPLPELALFAGIFLQALSATLFTARLLRDGHPRDDTFCVLFVLCISLSLSLTRLSRFAGFSGFDFLRERAVSQNTIETHFWDPSLAAISNYQSSLAITILPTIASQSMRLPLNTMFLLQTFLLVALLPSVVQTVLRSLTGDLRLSTLSALLLSQNWFFFSAHVIAKTAPALVLSVLSLYCLTKRDSKLRGLGVLLGLGVAMAHYTIALLLSFMLLATIVWLGSRRLLGKVPIIGRMPVPELGIRYSILSVVLIATWLLLTAPSILPDASLAAQQAVSTLIGGSSGPRRVDTSLALSSPAGPIVTAWFDFQNGLIGLGALMMANDYRKSRTGRELSTWMLCGMAGVVLLGAWLVLPWLSLRVESTRILGAILPFAALFPAILLNRLSALGKVGKPVILILVFLLLPMNMMLPNQHQNVFYHPLTDLPLEKRLDLESSLIPRDANYAVAHWVNNYLPLDKLVEVDAVGRYVLLTALPFPSDVQFAQEGTPPYTFRRYTILSSYFVGEQVWGVASLGARILAAEDPSPFFSPNHDIIYSSSRFLVATPWAEVPKR